MNLEQHRQRMEKFIEAPPEGGIAEAGTFADSVHRATLWKAGLLDEMFGYFNILLGGDDDDKIMLDDLTVDWYDNSMELKSVQAGIEIPESLAKTVYEFGFSRFWVCFSDGTEKYFYNKAKEVDLPPPPAV